ncbi:MAG: PilW family protein [Thermodesulfobacteriota bacterium]
MMADCRYGRRSPRGNPEAGFTLIEVMAALAILGIAMTAVFSTFISQQQSFTTQSRVAEMQQNLRLAVDCMTRDIRMAGYGMPMSTNTASDNVALPAGVLPGGITAIRAIFPVDNNAGPDQIYILYRYDMDLERYDTVNNLLLPPPELQSMAADRSFVTVDNSFGFLAGGGEHALVTDGATADLFQSTSVVGATVNFAGGGYNGAHHTKVYVAGATPGFPPSVVSKARFVRYFIDNSDPARPTLMLDRMIPGQAPQPVADDIEDMQFTYGLDTNADGNIDAFRCDSGGTVITAAEVTRIRQVRMHLIARSRLPEGGMIGTRPALANRPAGGTDGYRRRIIEVNIDARNSGT